VNQLKKPAQNLSVTVISDNNPYEEGLEAAWGFSALIKGAGKTILFDTGIDGTILLRNMEKLNISPKEVDIVVLSHIHGDHVGGLKSFLEKNPNVTVYVLKSFPADFKKDVENFGTKVVEIKEAFKICENVYSAGELGILIKEQSLIVQTDNGLIVITGCAHPDIIKIVEKAKEVVQDDVLLVMGGFHLRDESEGEIKKIISSFRKLGIRFTAPSHCTGDLARQLFERGYHENFILSGVGKVISMEDLR